jgi:sirohydrochlorin cobaltochelatase
LARLSANAWLRVNIRNASGTIHDDYFLRMTNSQTAIVLFAHGSRDPKWAEPFKAIQSLIRAQAPNVPVELAFLELMQPGIQECLTLLANQGVTRVSVVPVFLAAGRHLREDLPALIAPIQAQFPELEINVSAPIGDLPEFQVAIAKLALAQIT